MTYIRANKATIDRLVVNAIESIGKCATVNETRNLSDDFVVAFDIAFCGDSFREFVKAFRAARVARIREIQDLRMEVFMAAFSMYGCRLRGEQTSMRLANYGRMLQNGTYGITVK